MRDVAARSRTGLNRAVGVAGAEASPDPRIRVDIAHLRGLEGPARALSFLPRQPAASVLSGRHASRLRGRGLDFEELRGYLPGDDVRSIDWKVTARAGKPHVRVYSEERDRPALLIVDQRMSMFFGSSLNMKSVTAAETAASAAFRILAHGDRVGGIVFGDEMIAEFRPQRSRRSVDAFLTALAAANGALHADAPVVTPMSLNRPLEAAARIARRDFLVLVVSDFDGTDERTETVLGALARHNDVVLCAVTDPLSHDLPAGLRLTVSDGLLQAELDAGTETVRRSAEAFFTGRLAEVLGWERRLGTPVLPLSSGEPTLAQLHRLMGVPGATRSPNPGADVHGPGIG